MYYFCNKHGWSSLLLLVFYHQSFCLLIACITELTFVWCCFTAYFDNFFLHGSTCMIGIVHRYEVWRLCCCAEYTHQVLRSFGRSFQPNRKHSWKRERLSVYRANRMRNSGKRFVSAAPNLLVICLVSDDGNHSFVTIFFFRTSHTHMVIQECCNGDDTSQWKSAKFDPSPHLNPLTDLNKNWYAWLRHGQPEICRISYGRCRSFCSLNTWSASSNSGNTLVLQEI